MFRFHWPPRREGSGDKLFKGFETKVASIFFQVKFDQILHCVDEAKRKFNANSLAA